jgi:hypothetical protein
LGQSGFSVTKQQDKMEGFASSDRMARVYLDTSTYNRPFDDQTQPKIFLESQAVIIILQMIEAKEIELIRPLAKVAMGCEK